MQHAEVVSALESLVPDIAYSGDPEGTLLKYARDNNLAPAQLERVGQVFNIAKTLNHMDKRADDRGGEFEVVDTVALLSKYMDGRTEAPAKSATSWADDWVDDPMAKAASDLPDFMALAEGRPGHEPELVVDMIEGLHKMATEVYREATRETVAEWEGQASLDVASDAQDRVRETFDKLAMDLDLWADPSAFAPMEEDITRLVPGGSGACDSFAGYLGSRGLNVERMSSLSEKRAFAYDRNGLVPTFEAIAEDLDLIRAAHEYRKQAATFPTLADASDDVDEGTEEEDPDPGPTHAPEGDRGGPPSGGESVDNLVMRILNSDRTKAVGAGLEEGLEDMIMNSEGIAGLSESAAAGVDSGVAGVSRALDSVSVDKARGAIAGVGDLIRPKSNKKQRRIDEAREDVEQEATLQAMLVDDPIISEADPDAVASYYDTLRKGYPEISTDPNLLRFALREAIEYEGVTPHMFKDLTSTFKEHEQGKDYQRQNQDAAYKI